MRLQTRNLIVWSARILTGAIIVALLWGHLINSNAAQSILIYEEDILYLVNEHLYLVFVSGGLAVLLGIPLGIWLSRPKIRPIAERSEEHTSELQSRFDLV